jgi:hypothetical protein
VAADEAAVGPDLDLQEGGVLGAADGGEGSAATLTAALRAGDFPVLHDGGQMGIIAASRPWLAGLLAAWSAGWVVVGGGGGGRGRGRGLGLAAEELLLAEA